MIYAKLPVINYYLDITLGLTIFLNAVFVAGTDISLVSNIVSQLF